MKATVVLVARMGSTRLPGKSLAPLGGRPMVERMVERIRRARTVDRIVLATTTLPEDDALERHAKAMSVDCHRGSATDVLGRVAATVERFPSACVVELLGDNPLVHGDLVDAAVERFSQGDLDFLINVTNEHPRAPPGLARFPVGVRVQAYDPPTIARAAREATSPAHREHSTSYIYERPESFRVGYLEARGRWAGLERPDWTFAVNVPKNLRLVNEIFDDLREKGPDFPLEDVVGVVERRPELVALMGNG